MTTTALSSMLIAEKKPSRRQAKPRRLAKVAISERFAIANREWYPGLRDYVPDECSADQSERAPEADDERAIEQASPAHAAPQLDDRFVMANREWFPALRPTRLDVSPDSAA